MSAARSIWTWIAVGSVILAWLPLLAVIRLFDRDPVRYRTGFWFRRLGRTLTRVNSGWKVEIEAREGIDPRHPYVVVGNHFSLADIPVVSCLPWEMKWVAKEELFRIPVIGWMMRLAGDIPVRRTDRRSGAAALIRAREYLNMKCSVMFFPEGTRSRDGTVGPFSDGPFLLAIRTGVPVLPLALEGTRDALPKESWRFGPSQRIRLRVLEPIPTDSLSPSDAATLGARVRDQIVAHLGAG